MSGRAVITPETLNTLISKSLHAVSKEKQIFTPAEYLKAFMVTAKEMDIPEEELTRLIYSRFTSPSSESEVIKETLLEIAEKSRKNINRLQGSIEETQENYKMFDKKTRKIRDLEEKKAKETLSLEIKRMKLINEMFLSMLDETMRELKKQREYIEHLNELALRDGLTGAYSRRMLEKIVNDALYDLRRYGRVFSLSMIDLDNFKNINDTYGHRAGDTVLIKFSELATNQTRQTDVLIRYGGDEFVMVFPSTQKKPAERAMEKIRERMEQIKFRVKKSVFSVSFSYGVAEAKPDDSLESLLKRADEEMYKDKMSRKKK